LCEAKIDHLARDWKKNDIILLLLTTYDKSLAEIIEYYDSELVFFEKPEDYRTIGCTASVLKLLDDYVTGWYIFPWEGGMSVPLKEFNEILHDILNSKL